MLSFYIYCNGDVSLVIKLLQINAITENNEVSAARLAEAHARDLFGTEIDSSV